MLWSSGSRRRGLRPLLISAVALVALAGAACGDGRVDDEPEAEDPPPSPQTAADLPAPPQPEPPPEPVIVEPPVIEVPPDPDPEPEVIEPEVTVTPEAIQPGETALVRALGVEAAEAVVTVAGVTTPLVLSDGVWLGYVSVTPLSETGIYSAVVDLFDATGAHQESLQGEFEVFVPEPEPPDAAEPGAAAAEPEVDEVTLPPEIAALLAPEFVAIDNHARFVEYTEVTGPPRWVGPWVRPVEGADDSPFGVLRSFNEAPASDWHHGHDIIADAGEPVWAAAAGIVVFADALPVHGLGVIIDHGAGVYSGYWHMSAIAVEEGAEVEAGEEVGAIGTTGVSTGPHLHWEVIVNGRDVDPLQWLRTGLHP